MWFHQRTGPGSGISYGLGTLILGFLIIGTVATNAWPAVLLLGVVVWAIWAIDRSRHTSTHEANPEPGCRWCERELADLRARERADADRKDRDRLRQRYQPDRPTPRFESTTSFRPAPDTKLARRLENWD